MSLSNFGRSCFESRLYECLEGGNISDARSEGLPIAAVVGAGMKILQFIEGGLKGELSRAGGFCCWCGWVWDELWCEVLMVKTSSMIR